jgi:hypothetical protein
MQEIFFMGLKELILQKHSQELTSTVVALIGNNKKRMAELMSLLIANEPEVSRRAAWLASEVAIINPGLVLPYANLISLKLDTQFTDPAIIRNVLRLLQNIRVPRSAHGGLMNKCFELITSPVMAPGIKANALSVLDQLADAHPEIRNELNIIIKDQLDNESPAFRSRAFKILKRQK